LLETIEVGVGVDLGGNPGSRARAPKLRIAYAFISHYHSFHPP